jgi:hypothetical protein
VLIVRWASGVTSTRQWAVAGPDLAAGVVYVTPVALRSWVKIAPISSSRTFPMKAARPPSEATPVAVLAADPPESSIPGPMAA